MSRFTFEFCRTNRFFTSRRRKKKFYTYDSMVPVLPVKCNQLQKFVHYIWDFTEMVRL